MGGVGCLGENYISADVPIGDVVFNDNHVGPRRGVLHQLGPGPDQRRAMRIPAATGEDPEALVAGLESRPANECAGLGLGQLEDYFRGYVGRYVVVGGSHIEITPVQHENVVADLQPCIDVSGESKGSLHVNLAVDVFGMVVVDYRVAGAHSDPIARRGETAAPSVQIRPITALYAKYRRRSG